MASRFNGDVQTAMEQVIDHSIQIGGSIGSKPMFSMEFK